MPRGKMTTKTKEELRQDIEKLKAEIEERERDLEEVNDLTGDLTWGLNFLGITANAEENPELFKQQVVYTAYQLGLVARVKPGEKES